MAAPSTTVRQTPAGARLTDGFPTKIAFSRDPDISFWETEVTPPGIDGGDAVETSTMFNTDWRTMAPRRLKTLTDATITAAYDPNVFNQLVELCNEEGSVTVTFSDGSTLSFYGYLKMAEPGACVEGEMPTMEITVVPTNYDPTNKVEAAPVLVSVSGT